ncbi:TIGR03086 family metal-binding protein [Catelliglobosispora koreensis]|uniref:TIGR03086 family metal-binding protein n=1 Tax=Catelliglobosispora koreensis TaxID=129052 RepID=UPI000375F1AB|nr:TIGR03086 family metal-binding protein [Catelliglobosispora koreensis]
MDEIKIRYKKHADQFEAKIAAVAPGQWANQSPCAEWTARDVVSHIVDMHAAMLRPVGRGLSPAPSVADDPLAAFRAARADVEAVLADPALAGQESPSPTGPMTAAQHIDQVVSDDMVLHGWDLARATGQDDTMDPEDVDRMWTDLQAIPASLLDKMRTPEAFGPGIFVYGPQVKVPDDASKQDKLLAAIGRQP